MSLIRLRQQMQRQGKRAAIAFVVLSLLLLAAHHSGLHTAHQQGAPTHHAMVDGHEMPGDMSAPAAPGPGAMIAICLAVLPALLLVALAVMGALALRGWWWIPSARSRLRSVLLPIARGAPARDGPRELCVIRC